MSNDNLRDLTLVKFQKLLSDNNTELKKINSGFNNLNKILSVFLIFGLNSSDFKKHTTTEIKNVIPKYTELLRTISESIK